MPNIRFSFLQAALVRESWGRNHNKALHGTPSSKERGVVDMLRGWYNYAADHEERYHSKIGADYVLGPAWFQIGSALLRLLNGDLGRLDGGTLDEFIRQTMLDNGFEQGMADDVALLERALVANGTYEFYRGWNAARALGDIEIYKRADAAQMERYRKAAEETKAQALALGEA